MRGNARLWEGLNSPPTDTSWSFSVFGLSNEVEYQDHAQVTPGSSQVPLPSEHQLSLHSL